jgi:hypothetical protein
MVTFDSDAGPAKWSGPAACATGDGPGMIDTAHTLSATMVRRRQNLSELMSLLSFMTTSSERQQDGLPPAL